MASFGWWKGGRKKRQIICVLILIFLILSLFAFFQTINIRTKTKNWGYKDISKYENPIFVNIPLEELPVAVEFVNLNPNSSSYFILLALREQYPIIYNQILPRIKAAVFSDELRICEFMDEWSVLSESSCDDSPSALALIETGTSALKFLIPMLEDRRIVFSIMDEGHSYSYQYRKADFAYRYIMLILGKKPLFHKNPVERDKEIEKLTYYLKSQASGS